VRYEPLRSDTGCLRIAHNWIRRKVKTVFALREYGGRRNVGEPVRRSVGGAEDRGQTDSTEVVLDAAEQTLKKLQRVRVSSRQDEPGVRDALGMTMTV
jgi:hypothetical protein